MKSEAMKVVVILFFSFVFFSCNSQQKDKKRNAFEIEKMVFYPIENFVESQEAIPVETTVLIFTAEKIYHVIEKYKGEEFVSADTLKTISNTAMNKKIISEISKKYLEKDQKFGTINAADEGALGITIYMKNGKQVIWEMSRIKTTIEKEVLAVYEIYEKTVQEFYSK